LKSCRELDCDRTADSFSSLQKSKINNRHSSIHPEDGLTIHQTLIDPDDLNDWSLHLTLDPEKSNEARTPVLHLESIAPI